MRTYYHFSFFPTYYYRATFGPPKLDLAVRRFDNFCRTYVDVSKHDFRCSAWVNINIHGIYAYQENGTIYEFFSGYCIGTGDLNKDRELELTKANIVNYQKFWGCTLSASQFASDVEPHMRHKEKIGRVMHDYFDLLHELLLAEAEKRILAQQKSNARDTHDASWLEAFLDNR